MTNKDKINFENTEQCYYCNKPFNGEIEDNLKVRDHDHYNGKYRGALHNICNLNAIALDFIPLYFYNEAKYDNHLFFISLLKKCKETNIKHKILAKDEQTYFSLQIGCIRCI